MVSRDLEAVIQKMRKRLEVAKAVHTNPVEIGVKDLEMLLDHLESMMSFVRDFEELEALDDKTID